MSWVAALSLREVVFVCSCVGLVLLVMFGWVFLKRLVKI